MQVTKLLASTLFITSLSGYAIAETPPPVPAVPVPGTSAEQHSSVHEVSPSSSSPDIKVEAQPAATTAIKPPEMHTDVKPVASTFVNHDNSSAMPVEHSSDSSLSSATHENNATISNETVPAKPNMPSAPELPNVNNIAASPMPPAQMLAVESNNVKIPPINKEIVQDMLSELNSQDPVKVSSLFTKDGFNYVNEKGDQLKSMSDIAAYRSNKHLSPDEIYVFKIESLQEQAPTIATAVGSYQLMDRPGEIASGKFIANIKFDGSDWKLNTFQVTEAPKGNSAQPDENSTNLMLTVAALLVGLVTGIFSTFIFRRKNP